MVRIDQEKRGSYGSLSLLGSDEWKEANKETSSLVDGENQTKMEMVNGTKTEFNGCLHFRWRATENTATRTSRPLDPIES